MTRPGETGFWSFLGVSTNMKSSIRFSPDSARQNGGICHRIPVIALPWIVEFRASVTSGSLTFLATDEACPYWSISNDVKSWSGLSLNMTKNDDVVSFGAQIVTNAVQADKELCSIESGRFGVRLTCNDSYVSVEVAKDDVSNYTQCGSPFSVDNGARSFFSFISTVDAGIGDSEIHGATVDVVGDYDNSTSRCTQDEASRSEIAVQHGNRGSAVERPVLQAATAVITEMERAVGVLEDGEVQTGRIRELLIELKGRLSESMAASELEKLIRATMTANLMKAERKMEKRKEAFARVESDLEEFKKGVGERLSWLNQHVLEVMAEAKDDAVKTLSEVIDMGPNATSLKRESKTQAREARASAMPTFLAIIALMELVCYVGFFFVQREKTHGFKKYD